MDAPAFPTQSNAADWEVFYSLTDADDGTVFDDTGWTATIDVVSNDTYDYPSITLTGDWSAPGVLHWVSRASEMDGLTPGMYRVGLILTNGTDTIQQFIGTLPVVEGV